ncbi:MAG TPA: polysaccharide deacetylase family protein [Polyangiaceae bacterium]|nr:polysaccharide deacetylase family protein [Polyangiaceae bacterium]
MKFLPLLSAASSLLLVATAACDDTSGDGGAGGAPASGGAPSDGGAGPGGAPSGACPDGGFVSLTYDDSLPSQLTTAVPALDAHGLHATFFLTSVSSSWGALVASGHELAAHTTVHPCPSSYYPNPGNGSEDFDLERMADELDSNAAAIEALGQPAPLHFAYPCGVKWVGADQDSYVPLVQERFAGARGVVGKVITTLTDAYDVPAYFSTGTAEQLIAIADNAVNQKGWVVFGFHGVGGDHTPVEAAAHEALLAHLVEADIPVLTFGAGLECKRAP